ncbi:MAG TPA: ATP-binding protein [Gemmatimonadaceae bacterium]|nr:ATP-binding protein [Gemmatimonadaceae bacterium]
MTFRSRALLAMLAAVVGPLVLFAVGIRGEVTEQLALQHEQRVSALAAVIERDLARESGGIGLRLETLASAMPDDDRLRLALRRGPGGDPRYLADWAGRAMRTAGLDALQLHDASGRILSSGQFRQDFDRMAPGLPDGVAARADPVVMAQFPTPEGPLLVLVRRQSVQIGGTEFVLVGGSRVDGRLLDRFSSSTELRVVLEMPNDTVGAVGERGEGLAADAVVRTIAIGVIVEAQDATGGATDARLHIVRYANQLSIIRRGMDRWLAAAALLAAVAGFGMGAWLSVRLSRPLADLAGAAGALTLSGTEPLPAVERDDEIGFLARRLTMMRSRLRASAEALREAERLATIGELARQVNHDIKNGLVPIRNVLRHLAEVQERAPADLAGVFGERRHTLDASVGYLDALARRYARLAPRMEAGMVEVAEVVREAVAAAQAAGAPVHLVAGDRLPPVSGDALAVRRILDNLVRNAVESLTNGAGSVRVRTERSGRGVRVVVSDTGRGMSKAELARAFDDFHTTKPNGTGLGLSVVRRLTSDLGARVHVETAPGHGTTITVEFPAARGRPEMFAYRAPETAVP